MRNAHNDDDTGKYRGKSFLSGFPLFSKPQTSIITIFCMGFCVAAVFILLRIGYTSIAMTTSSYVGVCIFDLSALMSPVNFQLYPNAREAQNFCLNNGFGVAAVSPNMIDHHYDYERKFLTSYFPEIWTEHHASSVALQVHEGIHIASSLTLITSYFDVDPTCAALISQHFENEMESERVGMSFIDVKSTGVSMQDMEVMLNTVTATCGNKDMISKRPCSDVPPDSQYTCARQKKWGKCNEGWMKSVCCYTCHGCACGLYPKSESEDAGGIVSVGGGQAGSDGGKEGDSATLPPYLSN